MSLGNRLLSAILLALLISFSAGAGLAVLQAARGVRTEQEAELDNARQAVAAALTGMPQGEEGAAALRRTIAAFDGSRHVRVTLLERGHAVAVSRPATAPDSPAWLRWLIVPPTLPILLPVGHGMALTVQLVSVPANESAERWGDLRTQLWALGLFSSLAAVLCSLTIANSLRPLTVLSQGMGLVGRGEPAPHLPEAGPPETASLAHAFNAMAASLRAAQSHNAALTRQVATIAEEERADIARDLHDEIGPLLFAVTAFTAAIGRQVESGDLQAVPTGLSSIQQAVARLQRAVRDMLGRLRDNGEPPADLTLALEDLVAFWRQMRPETRFTLQAELPAGLSQPMRDCLFRAAQEGINNAVRHGGATLITVTAMLTPGSIVLRVCDDGAGTGGESAGSGSGLAGMQARAAALGGAATITNGRGWTVTVALPRQAPASQSPGVAAAAAS